MERIWLDQCCPFGATRCIDLYVSAPRLDSEVDGDSHCREWKRRLRDGYRSDADFVGDPAINVRNDRLRRNVKFQAGQCGRSDHDFLRSWELDVNSMCGIEFGHPDCVRQDERFAFG